MEIVGLMHDTGSVSAADHEMGDGCGEIDVYYGIDGREKVQMSLHLILTRRP